MPCVDPNLRVEDFAYELPDGLIAQEPLPERDASRLLVLARNGSILDHGAMVDLPRWLKAGDLLVANNSRVLAARLRATKPASGGNVEVLLLRPDGAGCWDALARPARRLRPGTRLSVRPHPGTEGLGEAWIDVVAVGAEGRISVAIDAGTIARLDAYGEVPLPPYVRSHLEDAERYQTVYGSALGSAAAPTAGLHFSPELLDRLRQAGVGWAEVTLHVGLDTFRPVSVESVADHQIHREWCEVTEATARAVAATRRRGGRVVAIGTTAARTLETLGGRWNEAEPGAMAVETGLFITPGYRWRLVDALLTNFHLPRSTLLMMVSSFAGRAEVGRAYAEAIERRYRFYSFGDAMLIV